MRRLDIAGDVIEQLRDIAADPRIRGEEAEIGVNLGGDRMVVAGAEMAVGAVALLLAADDHRGLGVGLELDEAVDDLHPCPLQRVGPEQILLLVEPGLQFDHRGHRLAGLGGVDQGADDRRLLAGAVERLLDRDDIRVLGRLAEEGDHHVERLVRVVDDDVLGADRGEAIAAIFADPLRETRRERREFEIGRSSSTKAPRSPMPRKPAETETRASLASMPSRTRLSRSGGIPASSLSRMTRPRRRRLIALRKKRTRSSASSSTSMSLSRMIRKAPPPSI